MKEARDKIAIVVQGPIYDAYRLVETYSKTKHDVIISTNNISKSNNDILQQLKAPIINNDLCRIPGRTNFNNQVRTTYSGLLMAAERSNKYALKIRSDLFTDDIDLLISKFNLNKIYFPAYHNHDGGYLCDHMLFGCVNFLIDLWNINESASNLAPEIQLTTRFYNIRGTKEIDYIFPILFDNNIIIEWPKYNKTLNTYKDDKLFSYTK